MCASCGWEDYLDLAENLAERGSDYAESVAGWIEDREHVTEAQKEALDRTAEAFGEDE